jgi:hypothetical protein
VSIARSRLAKESLLYYVNAPDEIILVYVTFVLFAPGDRLGPTRRVASSRHVPITFDLNLVLSGQFAQSRPKRWAGDDHSVKRRPFVFRSGEQKSHSGAQWEVKTRLDIANARSNSNTDPILRATNQTLQINPDASVHPCQPLLTTPS